MAAVRGTRTKCCGARITGGGGSDRRGPPWRSGATGARRRTAADETKKRPRVYRSCAVGTRPFRSRSPGKRAQLYARGGGRVGRSRASRQRPSPATIPFRKGRRCRKRRRGTHWRMMRPSSQGQGHTVRGRGTPLDIGDRSVVVAGGLRFTLRRPYGWRIQE